MPNNGAVSPSALNCGGSYTIPKGYHNGSGKVTANSLASQTDANATASQILSGQTAWVKGSKVTGTMANKGAVTQALNAGGSYTIPAGYHNGSGKVTANSLSSQGAVKNIIGSATSNALSIVGNGSKKLSTFLTISGLSFRPSTITLMCGESFYSTSGSVSHGIVFASSSSVTSVTDNSLGCWTSTLYIPTGGSTTFQMVSYGLKCPFAPYTGTYGEYLLTVSYSSGTLTFSIGTTGSSSYCLKTFSDRWLYNIIGS